MSSDKSDPPEISPATRRRLQQSFEHGTKSAAKGDFSYAADMFVNCVAADPGNKVYVIQLLTNLSKKYKDNKKGSGFTAAPKIAASKGSIKKAAYSKDWMSVTKAGLEVLKLNPWDVSALMAMSDACEGMGLEASQLAYLKFAQDANPKDADVNRKCARALASLGHFDQAITCWQRVEQVKPGDEEATRAIGNLAVERTISKGGYEDARGGRDVRADKGAKAAEDGEPASKLTPEQQLEKAIAKAPDELSNYLELADLHNKDERYKQAAEVLARAVEVSGGETSVKERLEDARLRHSIQQFQIAEKLAAKEKTAESIDRAKKMKVELNNTEIDYYRQRADRYPNNAGHKFELGMRLKRGGNFNEAIGCYQKALGEPKRKAQTLLELGECFQQIKQYKLAMQNYEASLEAISPREVDLRKTALYRAGRLSLALAEKYHSTDDPLARDETARAEKYLSELAALEFGYKDVPALLDKITKLGDKG